MFGWLELITSQLKAVLLLATGATVLALAGALWFYQARAANLRDQLDIATLRIEAYENAARVYKAHIERMAAENAHWEEILRDLQNAEGRDAPLSDDLRGIAKRMWR